MNTISSAIAYLESKETDIMPSEFHRHAESLRASIAAGKIPGVAFHVEEKQPSTKPPRSSSIEKAKKCYKLMQGGLNLTQASKQLNTNTENMRKHMDMLGLKYKSRYKRSEAELMKVVKQALKHLKKGVNMANACRIVGCQPESVQARLARLGYKYEKRKLTAIR